jgi:hypothetical protein
MIRAVPSTPTPTDDPRQYMVEIKSLALGGPGGVDRGERYRLLRDHAIKVQNRLFDLLESKGLRDSVEVSPPTAFDMLLVRGPKAAIDLIRTSDDVIQVLPIPDRLDVDLLVS